MWHLKYGTYEPIYKTETDSTHRHRDETCACQGGGGWERDGLGIWGCKLNITFRMDKQQGLTV